MHARMSPAPPLGIKRSTYPTAVISSVADALVTNFHMPLSTMLMSVAAVGGFEHVMNAYKVALEEGYQFGTYGDAMLII